MIYRTTKTRIASEHWCPFVCQLIPFICINEPVIIPFVGKKIPSVYNKGVTLVELIIVLTIAGILTTLAAPGMQRFVTSNRLTTQVNDLLADISLARSESIKRNATTRSNTSTGICASTTGTSCTAGGNWANGWLVYYDDSGAKTVLKVHEALSGENTLSVIQTDVSTNATASVDTVSYSNNGSLSSAAYTYRFSVCDPKRKSARMIGITVVGQTSVSSGTC